MIISRVREGKGGTLHAYRRNGILKVSEGPSSHKLEGVRLIQKPLDTPVSACLPPTRRVR